MPEESRSRCSKTKIHFVSGKGGVGKSTVAAALALAYGRKGLKTLLVELAVESFYQEALGKSFSAEPSSWRNGVDIAVWNGSSCLREYALHLLKSETLYRLFFENSVMRTMIQVAPGLAEMAMLGKITSGPPRNVGPKLNYDVIVVDAFATGHFMALLKAPHGFSESIRRGPMGEQTRSIIEVLKNPELTSYLLVALAEELPLQETLELKKDIRALFQSAPSLVVDVAINRWIELPPDLLKKARPSLIATIPEPPVGFREYLLQVKTRQEKALQELGAGSLKLSWLFTPEFSRVVQGLSEELSSYV